MSFTDTGGIVLDINPEKNPTVVTEEYDCLLYTSVSDYCRRNMHEVAFNVWIKKIKPVGFQDGNVVVSVRTPFQKEIIEKNYLNLLNTCLLYTSKTLSARQTAHIHCFFSKRFPVQNRLIPLIFAPNLSIFSGFVFILPQLSHKMCIRDSL